MQLAQTKGGRPLRKDVQHTGDSTRACPGTLDLNPEFPFKTNFRESDLVFSQLLTEVRVKTHGGEKTSGGQSSPKASLTASVGSRRAVSRRQSATRDVCPLL